MVVLPADHRIADEAGFRAALAAAAARAASGDLVTLGIAPTGPRPATATSSPPASRRPSGGWPVWRVERFVEKPSRGARDGAARGRPRVVERGHLRLAARTPSSPGCGRTRPDILEPSERRCAAGPDALAAAYPAVRATSIDYALLEPASLAGGVARRARRRRLERPWRPGRRCSRRSAMAGRSPATGRGQPGRPPVRTVDRRRWRTTCWSMPPAVALVAVVGTGQDVDRGGHAGRAARGRRGTRPRTSRRWWTCWRSAGAATVRSVACRAAGRVARAALLRPYPGSARSARHRRGAQRAAAAASGRPRHSAPRSAASPAASRSRSTAGSTCRGPSGERGLMRAARACRRQRLDHPHRARRRARRTRGTAGRSEVTMGRPVRDPGGHRARRRHVAEGAERDVGGGQDRASARRPGRSP